MPVSRRRVFYIPGFDPFPPRRYRELYRREGAVQADLLGYVLRQFKGQGPFEWIVEAEIEGAQVTTSIEVLVWSDLVSDSMRATIPATYAQLARTVWTYVSSGAFRRLARLRRGPVVAALYPVVVLMLQAAVALAAGLGVAALVIGIIPAGVGRAAGWILGPIVTALLVWGILGWFKAHDGRIFAHYLMHDYAFTARDGGAYPPELEARLSRFADRIADALEEGWDEVLVVGHSSGAHLGVSVLADLVRSGRADRDRLSFLSLGQVIPMVSFLPEARRLRADLALLSGTDGVPWVDVSAPADGCAFALCDPVAVSGVGSGEQQWPLVLSAAFTRTLSVEAQDALKWRFFRRHFQYLCAFDALDGRPEDYDYFRVTAGPMRLADRFAGRAPSPSRVTAPLSPYTDRAA